MIIDIKGWSHCLEGLMTPGLRHKSFPTFHALLSTIQEELVHHHLSLSLLKLTALIEVAAPRLLYLKC